MLKNLYFCEKCRKSIEGVGNVHFVEDNSDRGFCCEKCIKEFYLPYMKELEIEEKLLRDELGLSDEQEYLDIVTSDSYLELALSTPDQVWVINNELGQKYFTHVLNIEGNSMRETVYFILICSYIEGEPSFVYYRTSTTSIDLLKRYQRDIVYTEADESENEFIDKTSDPHNEFAIPTEVIESLELKKSQILADMLSTRTEGDISFEDFVKYDNYLEQTIESPDEIYEFEDIEGDTLNTFIKSFKIKELSFFYVVILFPYDLEKNSEKAILPILGFPSIDNNLYSKYAIGKNINEVLKN